RERLVIVLRPGVRAGLPEAASGGSGNVAGHFVRARVVVGERRAVAPVLAEHADADARAPRARLVSAAAIERLVFAVGGNVHGAAQVRARLRRIGLGLDDDVAVCGLPLAGGESAPALPHAAD